MAAWLCWTRWARRSLAVRRRCAAANPTPSTRRPSSSRWRCSSCWTSRCWSPSTTGAPWSARRWWAGSPWVRTAAARRSSSTGWTWRTGEARRSVAGMHCWRPNATRLRLLTRKGSSFRKDLTMHSRTPLSTAPHVGFWRPENSFKVVKKWKKKDFLPVFKPLMD